MKGLMVSLVIVFFAGTASSVLVAATGQQVGEDAAGFKPRLGQGRSARSFERPGPDDSADEVAWPNPASLLSRSSTTTSQLNPLGDRQAGPSASNKDIRFDVKIDDEAVNMLRQGRKVYSDVKVRDQSTNTALDPSVVSDIALFHDGNAGKNLQGYNLEPQPMQLGSRTLLFEIQEQQLERIEDGAFQFNVPDDLRGKFDRVEFVAVSSSGGSQIPSGLSSPPRGLNETSRFAGTNETAAQRWNTSAPQPGPGAEPGEREFIGPYINPAELQSRQNRVAPLDTNNNFSLAERSPRLETSRNFNQLPQISRTQLETRDRFSVAEPSPQAAPKSPFGRVWEQPDNNLSTNRNAFDGTNSNNALVNEQVRIYQQQVADARAKADAIAREASDWKEEAARLARQRNDLDERLRLASNRQVTAPARTQQSTSYLGQAVGAAGNAVRSFGTRREDFQTQENSYAGWTQAELDLRQQVARLQDEKEQKDWENRQLTQRNHTMEDQLAEAKRSQFGRRPAFNQDINPTGFSPNDNQTRRGNRTANANDAYHTNQAESNDTERRRRELAQNPPGGRTEGGRTEGGRGEGGRPEEGKTKSSGPSDLLWLLALLLASSGLNVFLWIHCRSLYLKYTDLADELRDMVGVSTI